MKSETVANSNPWILRVAVLFVFPGTVLSVVFGLTGILILLLLLADYEAGGLVHPAKGLHPIVQVLLTLCFAGALGGLIALVAWIV